MSARTSHGASGRRRPLLLPLVLGVLALALTGLVNASRSPLAHAAADTVWTPLGPGNATIRALAVNPDFPNTVYAGGSGVWRSDDGGAHWRDSGLDGMNVSALAIDRANARIIYAGTGSVFGDGQGVFKSTDGGDHWTAMNNGLDDLSILSVSINHGDLWIGTNGDGMLKGGLFHSTDGGATWPDHVFPGTQIQAVLTDPLGDGVYFSGGSAFTYGWFRPSDHLWQYVPLVSNSAGSAIAFDPHSQQVYYGGEGLYAGNRNGMTLVADAPFGTQSIEAIAAGGGKVYVAPYEKGIYVSPSGAQFLTAATNGLTNQFVLALAVDPVNPANIYAGTAGQGVFKSTDDAAHWKEANNGLPMTDALAVAVDPTTETTIYLGGIDPAGGGLYQSTDGGGHWTDRTDVFGGEVNAVAVDPKNPQNVYAATCGYQQGNGCRFAQGVFKSTDGGVHWSAISSGLSRQALYGLALAVDPTTPSTVYLGTAAAGVYKSTSGGASWSAAGSGISGAVTAIAVDPKTPGNVYAAVFGGGVYKSTDGGGHWTAAGTGLGNPNVTSLAVDPATPANVYAGTFGGGVFASSDGGGHWSAPNTGLTNTFVTALALDPRTPSTIAAGAGSVFVSGDRGASWSLDDNGLTAGAVNALAFAATGKNHLLFAATPVGAWVNAPAPLSVTGLDPSSGPVEGGTTVTISGSSFSTTGGTAFFFGANPATNVQCTSTTQCTAKSPPGDLGPVHVTAKVGSDTSDPTSADIFTYRPVVTSISPRGGSPAGGTTVTITGTGLTSTAGPTTVNFGPNAATNVNCSSATHCTAKSPAGTGTQHVLVAVNGVSSTGSSADLFTYGVSVGGVSPSTGTPDGGTPVTITGTGFSTTSGGTTFMFGPNPATDVICVSDTQCTVTSPKGQGKVDVIATVGTDHSAATPSDQFSYAVTVTGLNPSNGTPGGGTLVTITGTGFSATSGVTQVAFGPNPAAGVVCQSEIQCTALSPSGTGTVDVIVTVDGVSSAATAASKFSYEDTTLTIDPRADPGAKANFHGDGWDPKGPPIYLYYDNHLTAPQLFLIVRPMATFDGYVSQVKYAHPLNDDNACTATVKAVQGDRVRTATTRTDRGAIFAAADNVTVTSAQGDRTYIRSGSDILCSGETQASIGDGGILAFNAGKDKNGNDTLHLSAAGTPRLIIDAFAFSPDGADVLSLEIFDPTGAISFGQRWNPLTNSNAPAPTVMLPVGPNFCIALPDGRAVNISHPTRTSLDGSVSGGCASGQPAAAPTSTCDQPGAQQLGATLPATTISGIAERQGDLTVNGNLSLDNGILCVTGNLTVDGNLTGMGVLIVGGRSVLNSNVIDLQPPTSYSLYPGGDVMIAPGASCGRGRGPGPGSAPSTGSGCPLPSPTATGTACSQRGGCSTATATATATGTACGRGGCGTATATATAMGTPCGRGGCSTPMATATATATVCGRGGCATPTSTPSATATVPACGRRCP